MVTWYFFLTPLLLLQFGEAGLVILIALSPVFVFTTLYAYKNLLVMERMD